jgi:hypothetical protein
MILARWRARRANRILIEQIHGEIVAAARAPALEGQEINAFSGRRFGFPAALGEAT